MLPAAILALALGAPVPPAKAKPVEIDLSEAYSTVQMKGLKVAHATDPKNEDNDLEKVNKAALRAGASNAFLVRGEDFAQALAATRRVYGDGWGGKGEPMTARGAKQAGDVWVVAFLGNAHSAPAAFEVTRVEVDEKTVRVVFTQPAGGGSKDFTPYVIWAKLGKIDPGVYRLELVDADQKGEVVLSRRVVVDKGKD